MFDDNATFTDEGTSTIGWTTSNGALSQTGSVLRLTKTAGGSNASMTKTITFTPTNRDWILYGKITSSLNTNDIGVVWFLNGAQEISLWLGSASASPSYSANQVSIKGTGGIAAALNLAGGNTFNYHTDGLEFALQFDSKFAQINLWLKDTATSKWKFSASVASTWFAPSPLQIQVLKNTAAPSGSWIEFDYLSLCKPNIVALGDSICAGANLYNPNRIFALSNDLSTWQYSSVLQIGVRNNLIVNKGVGSQSSAQITARINEATQEGPRLVVLHASSNDEALAVSQATRTTNIQSAITSIKTAGQKVALLNAMYGTQAGAANTPTPDLRDYMTLWWNTYRPTLTGVDYVVDIMQPLIDGNGFMQSSLTQADGIHPTPTGYAAVGVAVAAVINLPVAAYSGSVYEAIQTFAPGSLVELFELDATAVGGGILRFCNEANFVGSNVVWQGQTYTRYPLQATGFEFSGNGQLPRPKLVMSNVTGAITLLLLSYKDLLGAKLTRRRTLVIYLDAVNFQGGVNPRADPAAEFPLDIFYIDRKASETRDVVEFELASSFDVAGVQLPRRQIIQNVCVWRYRGGECGYSGASYWDGNDSPVGSLALDTCGKRLSSCKLRFGANNPLPFGSFPVAGLTR